MTPAQAPTNLATALTKMVPKSDQDIAVLCKCHCNFTTTKPPEQTVATLDSFSELVRLGLESTAKWHPGI